MFFVFLMGTQTYHIYLRYLIVHRVASAWENFRTVILADVGVYDQDIQDMQHYIHYMKTAGTFGSNSEVCVFCSELVSTLISVSHRINQITSTIPAFLLSLNSSSTRGIIPWHRNFQQNLAK